MACVYVFSRAIRVRNFYVFFCLFVVKSPYYSSSGTLGFRTKQKTNQLTTHNNNNNNNNQAWLLPKRNKQKISFQALIIVRPLLAAVYNEKEKEFD